MLVHMFEKCNLHDLFIPGFPALVEAFYIQERLIEKHLPKVSKHMVIFFAFNLKMLTLVDVNFFMVCRGIWISQVAHIQHDGISHYSPVVLLTTILYYAFGT